MIFVVTGMDAFQFDRLVRAVDELQGSGAVREEFLIQLGASTYQPRWASAERFLPFPEVRRRIREASAVITHAGAGSTLVCIEQGKHPILVPRKAEFGEIVDDHQVPFAAKLAERGLASIVQDLRELPRAIDEARVRSAPADAMGRATELTGWLQGVWADLERRRTRAQTG